MTMILKWTLTLTSNSTTFPYLMLLPLSIAFSLFKFHHPIPLFLLSADDFVFSFIKNMAAFKQALLYFSPFPPSVCTVSVLIHSISPLHDEWAFLLLRPVSPFVSWYLSHFSKLLVLWFFFSTALSVFLSWQDQQQQQQSLDLTERVVWTHCLHVLNLCFHTTTPLGYLSTHKTEIHLPRSPMILSLSKLVVSYQSWWT